MTETGFVTVSQIVNIFNDDNCPQLKERAKVLLFSTCRASLQDKIKPNSSIIYENQNKLSNMFVGFATKEGLAFDKY